MNENQKAIYDGRQIPTPEINGNRYVAMKPLVEGMGLDWTAQFELIQRDEVLKSVVRVMPDTGTDGKTYQMVCLPEDFLQGWLFKIPASRYKGERREKLVKYQRECYKALHDYWNNGGAINPRATDAQVNALAATIRDMAEERALLAIENRNLKLALECSAPIAGTYGAISNITLCPKLLFRRSYWKSNRKKKGNDFSVQLRLAIVDAK